MDAERYVARDTSESETDLQRWLRYAFTLVWWSFFPISWASSRFGTEGPSALLALYGAALYVGALVGFHVLSARASKFELVALLLFGTAWFWGNALADYPWVAVAGGVVSIVVTIDVIGLQLGVIPSSFRGRRKVEYPLLILAVCLFMLLLAQPYSVLSLLLLVTALVSTIVASIFACYRARALSVPVLALAAAILFIPGASSLTVIQIAREISATGQPSSGALLLVIGLWAGFPIVVVVFWERFRARWRAELESAKGG